MKKLLSILLTFMVCLTLVGVSTNRVNAEDEGIGRRTREKTQEQVEEPAEEEKEEELPGEISEEEKEEIEETIEEIEKEVKEETPLLQEVQAQPSNETELDFTLYVNVGEHKVYQGNTTTEYVSDKIKFVDVEQAVGGKKWCLKLNGLNISTKTNTGIYITNFSGDTLDIILEGINVIEVAGNGNAGDRYGIKSDGNIRFVDGVSAANALQLKCVTGPDGNYGIYAYGNINIELDSSDKTPLADNVSVTFAPGSNGLGNSLYGIKAEKNLTIKGFFTLLGEFNTYALNNAFLYAGNNLSVSELERDYGPWIVFEFGPKTNNIYYSAGLAAKTVSLDNTLLRCEIDSGDFAFCIDATDIDISGSQTAMLLVNNSNYYGYGGVSNVPLDLSSDIYALAVNYTDGTSEEYNRNNNDDYSIVKIGSDKLVTLEYVNADGHTKDLGSRVAAVGDKVNLSYFEPEEVGYEFDGWYANKECSGDKLTEITLQADTKVYAKWKSTPVVLDYTVGGGVVGEDFYQKITLAGATPDSWEIASGTLPTGLSFNTDTGEITGTPEEKETKTVKFCAHVGENTYYSGDIDIQINNSKLINFVVDPGKALMLLKEFDEDATFEYNGTFPTLTVHNLDLVTNESAGLVLPDNTVLKVYGDNVITVNGVADRWDKRLDNTNNATSRPNGINGGTLSAGIVTRGNVYIVAGNMKAANRPTLKVSTNSEGTTEVDTTAGIIMSCSYVDPEVYVDGANVDIHAGKAIDNAYGILYIQEFDDNADVLDNYYAALCVYNSNVNIVADKTVNPETIDSSCGLRGFDGYYINKNSKVIIQGDSAAATFNYDHTVINGNSLGKGLLAKVADENTISSEELKIENQIDSIDDISEDAIKNYSIDEYNVTNTYLGRNKGIFYGIETDKNGNEVKKVMSNDGIDYGFAAVSNAKKSSNNFYLDDGTGVVKKMVISSPESKSTLFFDFKTGKFYYDAQFTKEYEGNYSYSSNLNKLTLKGIEFNTCAIYGLYIPGDINIELQDGTTNNISVAKGRNGIGIYVDGNLTISGEGSLGVSTDEMGIYAAGNITINGGNNRISSYVGICSGNGDVTVNGGDSYIYGYLGAVIREYNVGTSEFYLTGGKLVLDTEGILISDFSKVVTTEAYLKNNDMFAGTKIKYFMDYLGAFDDGKDVIQIDSLSELDEEGTDYNWFRALPKGEKHYESIKFIVNEDNTAGWYTEESNKPIQLSGWSYDGEERILTLDGFNFTSNAATGIILPIDIGVELVGKNNKIIMAPEEENNYTEAIQIKNDSGNDKGISFMGDGNLTIEYKDSGRSSGIYYGCGIYAVDFEYTTYLTFINLGTIDIKLTNITDGNAIMADKLYFGGKINLSTLANRNGGGIMADKLYSSKPAIVNVLVKGGNNGINTGVEVNKDISIYNSSLNIEVDGSTVYDGNATSGAVGLYSYTGDIKINDDATVFIQMYDSAYSDIVGIKLNNGSLLVKDSALSIYMGNCARTMYKTKSLENINVGILGNDEDKEITFDNAKVTISAGSGYYSEGIAMNGDINVTNDTLLNVVSSKGNDSVGIDLSDELFVDSQPQQTFAYDNLTQLSSAMDKQNTLVEEKATLTSNPIKASVQVAKVSGSNEEYVLNVKDSSIVTTSSEADYSAGMYVDGKLVVDNSTIISKAGNSDETSVGINANNVEFISGSINSEAKANDNTCVALSAKNLLKIISGDLNLSVVGTPGNNSSVYKAGLLAGSIDAPANYIKKPEGAKFAKYNFGGTEFWTVVGKDGKPVIDEISNTPDYKPTPTPVPTPTKDESCEKVIGPTWHWNNKKGICEDSGSVKTYSR